MPFSNRSFPAKDPYNFPQKIPRSGSFAESDLRVKASHGTSPPCLLTRSQVVVCCSELECVGVCCSVLQCIAVCCSVLQCVAVCCSAPQCAAFSATWHLDTIIIAYIDSSSLFVDLFPSSCHTIPVLAHFLFCGSSSNRLPHPAVPRRLLIFIPHRTSFPARL